MSHIIVPDVDLRVIKDVRLEERVGSIARVLREGGENISVISTSLGAIPPEIRSASDLVYLYGEGVSAYADARFLLSLPSETILVDLYNSPDKSRFLPTARLQ